MKKQYDKWSVWIGNDEKNLTRGDTLWGQFGRLINNDFLFRSFFKAIELSGKSTKNNFSNNHALPFLLIDGYFAYQITGIRRIVGSYKDSDTHSIRRLIESIEVHANQFNRETYISILGDGCPYLYQKEEIFEKEWRKKLLETIETKKVISRDCSQKWQISKKLHERFDAISGTDEFNRKRCNTIHPSYMKELKKQIDSKAIMDITKNADAFWAHTFDRKKSDSLDISEKKVDLRKIRNAHKSIFLALNNLEHNFWQSARSAEFTYYHDEVLAHFQQPFTTKDIEVKVAKFMREESRKLRRWGMSKADTEFMEGIFNGTN